jgi:hypothetical protein
LEDWTHVAWLATRSTLSRGVVAEHAVILPESLIDRDAQPHAHRWLREQPLVCVSGTTWRRLSTAGVCVFRVAFDVAGDRVLDIESPGSSNGPTSVTVALDALESAVGAQPSERSSLDVQGDPSPIDRVLRLVSGGVLDESSVANAFDARSFVEDGYGYRGALEGSFNEISRVAQGFEALDDLFGQIFERAESLRAVAKRLVAALGETKPEATAVVVPHYGTARSVSVPALAVALGEPWVFGGEAKRDLELLPERRWSVDGSDAWSPQLSARLARILSKPAP